MSHCHLLLTRNRSFRSLYLRSRGFTVSQGRRGKWWRLPSSRCNLTRCNADDIGHCTRSDLSTAFVFQPFHEYKYCHEPSLSTTHFRKANETQESDGMSSPNAQATLGPLYIGTIAASVLYGATCVQTYIYAVEYPSDSWQLQTLVVSVFVLDTVHEVLISVGLYTWGVGDYGDPQALNRIVRANTLELFFAAFTVLLAGCFFTYRIWSISERNKPMTAIVFTLVISAFVVTTIVGAVSVDLHFFFQLAKYKVLASLSLALTALSDVVTAGTLSYYLLRKRRGVTDRTRTLLTKIVTFSLESTAVTCCLIVTCFVLDLVLPRAQWTIGLYHLVPRAYVNCLLATLNARKGLRAASWQSTSRSNSNSTGTHDARVARLQSLRAHELTAIERPKAESFQVAACLEEGDVA